MGKGDDDELVQRQLDAMMMAHRLESTMSQKNEHPLNLFYYLLPPSGHLHPSFFLPETLVIKNGLPSLFCWTDPLTGSIKRRSVDKPDDRAYIYSTIVSRARSYAGLTGSNKDKKIAVVANYINHHVKGIGTDITQLNEMELHAFLLPRYLRDGVVQVAVSGAQPTKIYSTTWSPTHLHVSRHVIGRVPKLPFGLITHDVLDPGTFPMTMGKEGNGFSRRLHAQCECIARHVSRVSPQQYQLAQAVFHFAADRHGKVYFFYASDLMVRTLAQQEARSLQALNDPVTRWASMQASGEESESASEDDSTSPIVEERAFGCAPNSNETKKGGSMARSRRASESHYADLAAERDEGGGEEDGRAGWARRAKSFKTTRKSDSELDDLRPRRGEVAFRRQPLVEEEEEEEEERGRKGLRRSPSAPSPSKTKPPPRRPAVSSLSGIRSASSLPRTSSVARTPSRSNSLRSNSSAHHLFKLTSLGT